MKTKYLPIVLLILVGATPFYACHKKTSTTVAATFNTDNNIQTAKTDTFQEQHQEIKGKWVWMKTICCGRVANVSTPEILKITSAIDFDGAGKARLFKNDSLEAKVRYRFFKSYLNDNRMMLVIGDSPRAAYFQINQDTLILDYSYMDLQTEWYVKELP